MDILRIAGFVSVFAVIMFGMAKPAKAADQNSISNRFSNLHNLAGKTRSQLLEILGAPHSVGSYVGGQTLVRWKLTENSHSANLAILFDDKDRFVAMSRDG